MFELEDFYPVFPLVQNDKRILARYWQATARIITNLIQSMIHVDEGFADYQLFILDSAMIHAQSTHKHVFQ